LIVMQMLKQVLLLEGISVNLINEDGTSVTDADGNTVASQLTDENGNYLFINLVPGNYKVTFPESTSIDGVTYNVTLANADGDDTDDTDTEGDTGDSNTDSDAFDAGVSYTVTLESGEDEREIDAGYFVPSSLGNYVWFDENGNGLQDADEDGVNDVRVELYTDDDLENFIGFEVTAPKDGEDGYYLFEDLAPDNYVVKFIAPDGSVLTTQDVEGLNTDATDDNNDSDANEDTGFTHVIMITSGEEDLRIDAGLYEPLSLGNFVWDDVNNNGVFDDGENPIADVTITLFKDLNGDNTPDENTLRTDVTDENGNYLFEEIGDYVWEDADADGVQDVNESGINDVMVTLFDATTDEALATTTTMSNPDFPALQGYYLFDNLTPGAYYVEFVAPEGYTTTTPGTTADDRDSDANDTGSMGIGMSPVYELSPGERELTVDAGYYQSAKVGDFVWLDSGTSNLQDPSDQGINGITVNLLDTDGNVLETQVTRNENGQDGYYMFTGLNAGTYVIQFAASDDYTFVIPNQGADDIDSDVVDFLNKTTLPFNVGPGECIEDVDAGLIIVLPIELASFTAKYNDTKDVNDLAWETQTEINSDRFEIERRHETESEFYYIGEEQAEINSLNRVEYNYADADIEMNGDYFYRLKMIDIDGTYEYSEIRVATVERGTVISTSIYPNPAMRYINLDIESGERADVTATLLTDEGRLVRANAINQTVDAGFSNLSIDLDNVPGGAYILRVEVGSEVTFHKILVVK